jgi:hypothetical protein
MSISIDRSKIIIEAMKDPRLFRRVLESKKHLFSTWKPWFTVMRAIYPPVKINIEYQSRDKRMQRSFIDHYAARRFYTLKLKQGKHPKVRRG